jgi:hypothetical protein
MPKADATGLAPKKSAYEKPSGALILCRRVSLLGINALSRVQRNHSTVSPSRGVQRKT